MEVNVFDRNSGAIGIEGLSFAKVQGENEAFKVITITINGQGMQSIKLFFRDEALLELAKVASALVETKEVV